MEEQKLTEQVLASSEANVLAKTGAQESAASENVTEEQVQQNDNLQVAEQILNQLVEPFKQSLLKLSNNQLRKVMLTMVTFPFITKKVQLHSKEAKIAFMYGERLIYANMVKRARIELDRTFGEVEKEKNEEQSKLDESQVNIDVAKTSDP